MLSQDNATVAALVLLNQLLVRYAVCHGSRAVPTSRERCAQQSHRRHPCLRPSTVSNHTLLLKPHPPASTAEKADAAADGVAADELKSHLADLADSAVRARPAVPLTEAELDSYVYITLTETETIFVLDIRGALSAARLLVAFGLAAAASIVKRWGCFQRSFGR